MESNENMMENVLQSIRLFYFPVDWTSKIRKGRARAKPQLQNRVLPDAVALFGEPGSSSPTVPRRSKRKYHPTSATGCEATMLVIRWKKAMTCWYY